MLPPVVKDVALLPFRAWAVVYRLRVALLRPFLGHDRAFELVSEALAARTGASGLLLRRAFYARALPRCGPACTIAAGVVFTKAGVTLGRNVSLGLDCVISAAAFGSDVMVGPGVLFLSGRQQHGFSRLDVPMVAQPGQYRTVHVGDDVWIGAGAIVMDDIGHGSIVAAGAVVSDAVPPLSIVAGNPARVVGRRTHRADHAGARVAGEAGGA